MANVTIKDRFRKSHGGGTNVKTIVLNTAGRENGDVITLNTGGLVGATIEKVELKTEALGTGTTVKVGFTQGTTSDDDFFISRASNVSGSANWIGIKDLDRTTPFDFTLTISGANITNNKGFVLQVTYNSYL